MGLVNFFYLILCSIENYDRYPQSWQILEGPSDTVICLKITPSTQMSG